MKTFSTFCASLIAVSCTLAGNAQFTEGFEQKGGNSYYESQGWTIYNGDWDGTSKMSEVGSIKIIPTTSNQTNRSSQWSQIVTPVQNLASGALIAFDYKLNNPLSLNAARTFTVKLMDDVSNSSITLSSFTITNTTIANVTQTASNIIAPIGSGNKRIAVNFEGDGDGNTGMYVDNIRTTPLSYNTTLPVKLLSFSGSIINKKGMFQWSVAENETGDRFELEKSTDGSSFTSIGTLFTTEKMGTDAYSFRDASELTATRFYRLKIVNKDNSTSYSRIITLKTHEESGSSSLIIVQNPVLSTLQFQYTAVTTRMGKAVLYNAAGVSVMRTDISLQKGNNVVSLSLDNSMNQGTYFLEISSGSEKSIAKMIKK